MLKKETWYSALSIYERFPSTSIEQVSVPLSGNGRLGEAKKLNGIWKYRYELTDHLGNVRAVIGGDLNSQINDVDLLTMNDYFPFGMPISDNRRSFTAEGYRYSYQGQEKEEDLSWFDFDLRMYDSRIGRWNSPDPYGQHFSPYLAMSNNPVSFIDPSGGEDSNPDDEKDPLEGVGLSSKYAIPDDEAWDRYDKFSSELISNISKPLKKEGNPYWNPNKGQYGYYSTIFIKETEPSFIVDIKIGYIISMGGYFKPDGEWVTLFDPFNRPNSTPNKTSIGQPGFGESLIPVWGSGRASIDHFQNGNWVQGTLYAGLAVSDVFLVKSIATVAGKGLWKLGTSGIKYLTTEGGGQFMKYQGNFVLNQSWKNWGSYAARRGWGPGEIQKTLLSGKWSPHYGPNFLNPGNSMSIVTNSSGRSLIIDNITKEIIQLGKVGHRF